MFTLLWAMGLLQEKLLGSIHLETDRHPDLPAVTWGRGTGARSLERRQHMLDGGRGPGWPEKMDVEFFLRANTRIIFTVKLILSRYWLKQGLS